MPRKKSRKHKPHSQKSLHEFYTEKQKKEDAREKLRKEHEKIEQEIFEHLKEHTKKMLKYKKGRH